jgi:hypothetical protein
VTDDQVPGYRSNASSSNDGFEALEWAATGLAREPGSEVVALCQACAPCLPL